MRKRKPFLDEWLKSGKAPDPNKLSRNTVDMDKWDKQDIARLRDEMPEFAAEADRFCDMVETGNAQWDDMFASLNKVEPKMLPGGKIRPSYLVNKAVQEEAMELKEFDELRSLGTVGDDVASAMGVMSMRPDLETLHDKLAKEHEKAKEIEKQLKELEQQEERSRTLEEMMTDLASDPSRQGEARNWQQEQEALNKQMEALRKQIREETEGLQKDLSKKGPMIRQQVKQGIKGAIEEAQGMSEAGDAWGLEPGSLQRLPAKERLALAQRFNNPRLRKIAELFGPMKRLMFTEQRRKVNHAPDEVYDIGLGNDLAHVLPQEFAKLRHPLRKFEFYKDFMEHRLPEYKMRGTEKVGRGPIIFCEDGSGSMSGERELWSKAVGLCLMNLSRSQKRGFRAIHFGSVREIWEKAFLTPEDYTTDNILEFAELFFGGGTDFVTPLSRALDHLRQEFAEFGSVKSDIVFVTDGACGVPEQWLKDFKAEQARLNFTVWGVSIGGFYADEPLNTICDGKVFKITDLHGGEDMRTVFNGIGGSTSNPVTVP